MSAAINTEVVFANPIDAQLNAFFVEMLDVITSEKERKLVQSLHQTLLRQNQIASVANTIEFEKQKAPSAAQGALTEPSNDDKREHTAHFFKQKEKEMKERRRLEKESLKLDDKDVWNTMAQQEVVEDLDLFPHCKGKIEDLPPL